MKKDNSMLLVIDVGNTNIVFAIYQKELHANIVESGLKRGQGWLGNCRLQSISGRTMDEYAFLMKEWFSQFQVKFNMIDAVVVSSVVPQITSNIELFVKKYLPAYFIIVGRDHFIPKMQILLDNPDELGSDRFINAWQAYQHYGREGQGLVVIDFGTATTFDVVDLLGNYCGGIIAPGVEVSMEALAKAAAKLSMGDFAKPESMVGKNTAMAMQSGFFYGTIGIIEKMISGINQEIGSRSTVIATGGLASMVAAECPFIERVDMNLTLNGLVALYYAQ